MLQGLRPLGDLLAVAVTAWGGLATVIFGTKIALVVLAVGYAWIAAVAGIVAGDRAQARGVRGVGRYMFIAATAVFWPLIVCFGWARGRSLL